MIKKNKTEKIPQCRCGKYKGRHFAGIICEKCATRVRKVLHGAAREPTWDALAHGQFALTKEAVEHVAYVLEQCNKLSNNCENCARQKICLQLFDRLVGKPRYQKVWEGN